MSEVSKKKKKQQAKAAASSTTTTTSSTTSTDAKLTEKNVAQHDREAGTLDVSKLAASLPSLGDDKSSPLTQQLLSLLQQGTTHEKDQVDPEALMAMFSGMKAKKDANALTAARGPITDAHAQREYKFWDTQPVPKLSEKPSDHGPIEVKTLDQVSKEPYPLPSAYEWDSCDINDPKVMDEVYNLLYENYVEDDDNMFRFDYSREFLHWALKPPGYRRDWHCGVRAKTNKKLFAFITGIPADMKVYDNKVPMVEINFLCVHKKLRSKRLAPVLIKEITRRVNAQNIWQAVYTAGVVLPKPVAQNRYYHRSLNPKKLIDIGFSRLHPRMTIARTIKLYKLPTTPQTPGIRPLEPRDYNEAHKLVITYLSKFQLVPHFSMEEFKHWFTPRDGVVNVYVVENPSTHKLTDLISFYHLPSTVIGNDKYNTLRAAYSFYNVSTQTSWCDLMNDALILAKNLDFDVFNALNVMENDAFLKDLKFGIGDGHLQYYLYNWKCPQMEPKDVALVLM